MNYCPNCGYHLAALQPKTQFPPPGAIPPGAIIRTMRPPLFFNGFPEKPYVTANTGVENGTKTSTKD